MNNIKIKLTIFLILFYLAVLVFSQNILADSNTEPPIDCISWFDGCNTCEVINGQITSCTKKRCIEYQESKCLSYVSSINSTDSNTEPPIDCISWFDGCNTCEVINGQITSCTKKRCIEYQESKCLSYPDFIYIQPDTNTGPLDVSTQTAQEQTDSDISYFCSGCEVEKKCYPFGYRKNGNFCSDKNYDFIEQKNAESSCENNFECSSNVCLSSKCINEGLIQKILNWFKTLFG